MELEKWMSGKDPFQVEKGSLNYSMSEVIKKLRLDGKKPIPALNQLMIMSGVDFRWQGLNKVVLPEDFEIMKETLANYKKEVKTRYWKLALVHGPVKMAYNIMNELSITRGSLMKVAKKLKISPINEGKVVLFKEKDYLTLKNHFESNKKENEVKECPTARKAIDILKKQKVENVAKGPDYVKYKDPKLNIEIFQQVSPGTSKEEKKLLKKELEENGKTDLISDFKARIYKLENDIQAQTEIISDKNFLLEKNKEKIESLERRNLDLTKKVNRLMKDLKGLSQLRNAISVLMNEGLKINDNSHNQPKYIERDFFED